MSGEFFLLWLGDFLLGEVMRALHHLDAHIVIFEGDSDFLITGLLSRLPKHFALGSSPPLANIVFG